ncbi:MAG: P1 family peptidase, partial [Pseudomonadota bacterium]
GSCSLQLPSGEMVGALMAVNAIGSATVGGTAHFWAAPFEIDGEFGGLGPAPAYPALGVPRMKGAAGRNTTIGIVATDATLTQAQCTRLAIAAHDGLARALMPAHTPFDGDLIFSAATGKGAPVQDTTHLGHAAAICVSRAIARAVFAATPAPTDDVPCWSSHAS